MGVYTIKLAPGARWELAPNEGASVARAVYFFLGSRISVGGRVVDQHAKASAKWKRVWF